MFPREGWLSPVEGTRLENKTETRNCFPDNQKHKQAILSCPYGALKISSEIPGSGPINNCGKPGGDVLNILEVFAYLRTIQLVFSDHHIREARNRNRLAPLVIAQVMRRGKALDVQSSSF
jgi:hypothetical protein